LCLLPDSGVVEDVLHRGGLLESARPGTVLCEERGLVLDRDLNAARNLAQLVDEVTEGMSSPSCGATRNEPEAKPHQTRIARAAGTATGRPGPPPGQRRRRKATAT
jgi:putative transposase